MPSLASTGGFFLTSLLPTVYISPPKDKPLLKRDLKRCPMKFFICVLGMVMIIEGLPYFAFPEKMKRWMLQIQEISDDTLRRFGLAPTTPTGTGATGFEPSDREVLQSGMGHVEQTQSFQSPLAGAPVVGAF